MQKKCEAKISFNLSHKLRVASAIEPMPKMEVGVNCSIDESSFGLGCETRPVEAQTCFFREKSFARNLSQNSFDLRFI